MWQDIKHSKIVSTEKLVGEYDIWVLEKSPYGKFKIKIFEKSTGGYTNLQVRDERGGFNCVVGRGETKEEALRNTIVECIRLFTWKSKWEKSDFQYSDPFDFYNKKQVVFDTTGNGWEKR